MSNHTEFEKLLVALQDQRDWRVRQKAVEQLSEVHTVEAMNAILTALYDESPHVVHTASIKLEKFGSAAIPGLLEALHSPKDIAARAIMVLALERIGDRRVIPDLVELLDHKDKSVRHRAVEAFQKMPDERVLPSLLRLLETEDEDSKSEVVRALGALGRPEAVPALTPLLYSAEQAIRRCTSIALGKIEDESTIQALLEASYSQDGDVRSDTTEGFALKRDERIFNRLVVLLRDPHGRVRGSASHALAKVDRERAVPYLFALLDDPDTNVQNLLHGALRSLKSLDVVPILMQQYRNDPNDNGQGPYSFARQYWNWDERREDAVHEALNVLHSEDQNLRVAAVWLLNVFNEQLVSQLLQWQYAGKKNEEFSIPVLHSQVLDILVGLLNDSNPDIRLSVLDSLKRTGNWTATEGVVNLLKDSDKKIVLQAAETLIHLRDSRAVPALQEVLNSPDSNIRFHVMRALSYIGGEAAFDSLVTMLNHPDSWTRGAAAYDLGIMGDKRATPILLEKLSQETDPGTREWIVSGLGNLEDNRATQAIAAVMNDTGDSTFEWRLLRSSAATALWCIKDISALPALYQAVNVAPEWQVRMAAVNAIAAIGSEREQADRLFELLGHEHDTVRTTASQRLGYLGAQSPDLDLRDYIVSNLIQRLQDRGVGYHVSPTVAHMASRSLYFIGTTEAIAALKNWKLKSNSTSDESNTD